jgi:hypothetical protein
MTPLPEGAAVGEHHLVTLQLADVVDDQSAARRPRKIYWGAERVEGVYPDSFSDTC